MLNKIKVAVLGGTGFIGLEVLRFLAADPSVELIWVKRVESCFPDVVDLPAPIIIEDLESVDIALLGEMDVIVDLVSRGRGRLSSQRDINLRVRGHCRLIDGLMNLGTKLHYVIVSSGGTIYGNTAGEVLRESTPINPNTEYGLEKAIIEMHLNLAASTGMEVSILRVSNAYGDTQPIRPGFGVIPTVVNALQNNIPFQIFGKGDDKRDYVNAVDISKAIQSAIRRDGVGVVNIGTGVGTSVNDLVLLAAELSGRSLEVEYIDYLSAEPSYARLDITRAWERLGWSPTVDLRAGVRSILAEKGLLLPNA